MCAVDVDKPASIVCTRCGGFACDACRLEGLCSKCASNFNEHVLREFAQARSGLHFSTAFALFASAGLHRYGIENAYDSVWPLALMLFSRCMLVTFVANIAKHSGSRAWAVWLFVAFTPFVWIIVPVVFELRARRFLKRAAANR